MEEFGLRLLSFILGSFFSIVLSLIVIEIEYKKREKIEYELVKEIENIAHNF